MGLFEELSVPARFNRLRKYFNGLGMYDLDPDYHYTTLVADVDKLIMAVFCNKYICTPDHKFIRRVLDQDDIGEENLEETIRDLEILVQKRNEDLVILQEELDKQVVSKELLEHEQNLLKAQRSLYEKQVKQLRQELDDEINAKNDLQYEHNTLIHKVREMENEIANLLCPICRPEDKTQSTDSNSDSNSDDPTQSTRVGHRKMTKFTE